MIRTHLAAGHDVFVPQFLGRADFIERLESLAVEAGVPFVEIALTLDRDDALAAFEERRTAGDDATHRDAEALVDRSAAADPVGELFDRYETLVAARPNARRVPVRRGEVDAAVAAVGDVLEWER
jgi:hypothetical protein